MITGLDLANPEFFPPPSDILDALSRLFDRDVLARHVIFSLTNFVIGYLLAVVVGVIFGPGTGRLPDLPHPGWPAGLDRLRHAARRHRADPHHGTRVRLRIEGRHHLPVRGLPHPHQRLGGRALDRPDPACVPAASSAHGVWTCTPRSSCRASCRTCSSASSSGSAAAIIGIVIAEFLGSSAGIGYLTKILVATDFDMAGAMAAGVPAARDRQRVTQDPRSGAPPPGPVVHGGLLLSRRSATRSQPTCTLPTRKRRHSEPNCLR